MMMTMKRSSTSHPCLVMLRAVSIAAAILLGLAPPAEAQNQALLRLLQVLRDRGSISAQEYEEIRKVAEAPQSPAPGQTATLEQRVADQEKAVAAIKAQTDGNPPPIVGRALAGKWYERISLRGYTQFRGSDVVSQDEGPALEVPNDRSVNDNESFVIRRGRFVFSGDITDRLSLYAQSDFNGSTGAADFSVQMRDLYADIWLDKAKFFRVRAGQSKVPFGWVNLQSSQNRAPLERPDGPNSAAEGERDTRSHSHVVVRRPTTAVPGYQRAGPQGNRRLRCGGSRSSMPGRDQIDRIRTVSPMSSHGWRIPSSFRRGSSSSSACRRITAGSSARRRRSR